MFYETLTRLGGGLTGTALVAAARLGRRCVYGGHLGRNELSDSVRAVLEREGVACRPTVEYPDALPTHTLVIVDASTGDRTNVARLGGVESAALGDWEKGLIAGAKCLLVDLGIPGFQVRAAAAALAAGVPVVGDLETIAGGSLGELYAMTNHLIIPVDVARRDLGASTPEEAVRMMMRCGGRAVACVTDSEKGAWYAEAGNPDAVVHLPAIVMPDIVDTNGCGDVFHGAYASALVEGRPVAERMRRAGAAAAMKTQKPGGQTGAPTARELEAFLAGL